MYLLDECLWPRLAEALVGRECQTVAQMGWNGSSDAALIEQARGTFQAILTSDRRFARRYSLAATDPAVVILRPRVDTPDSLIALAPKVEKALATLQSGAIVEVRWWD